METLRCGRGRGPSRGAAYERSESEDLLDVNDFRMAEEIRGQHEEQAPKKIEQA